MQIFVDDFAFDNFRSIEKLASLILQHKNVSKAFVGASSEPLLIKAYGPTRGASCVYPPECRAAGSR